MEVLHSGQATVGDRATGKLYGPYEVTTRWFVVIKHSHGFSGTRLRCGIVSRFLYFLLNRRTFLSISFCGGVGRDQSATGTRDYSVLFFSNDGVNRVRPLRDLRDVSNEL